MQKVLADWRIENPTGGGTTAGYPGVGSEAYHDQSPEQNMMLYAEEQSSRLSASELNMQRGRELQDWKEQRVNEAVALIRVSSAALHLAAFRMVTNRSSLYLCAAVLLYLFYRQCNAKRHHKHCNLSRLAKRTR